MSPVTDLDDDDDKPRPTGPNYMTPSGFAKMLAERDQLRKVERPRVVSEVAEAAAMGDRSENAEYIYGKRRLREIDRRLRFLDQRLDRAQVVDPRQVAHADQVYFGATVTAEDDDGNQRTWTVVGEDEVDLSVGHISHRSPVGAALLGKRKDDEVRVQTPSGVKCFYVIRIAYS